MVLVGMMPPMVPGLWVFVPFFPWTRRLTARRYDITKGTLPQNLAQNWLQQWIERRKILVLRRSKLKEF